MNVEKRGLIEGSERGLTDRDIVMLAARKLKKRWQKGRRYGMKFSCTRLVHLLCCIH